MTRQLDLLVAGDLDLDRLTRALAVLASVPVEDVDMARSDSSDRRWEATVLCAYEARGGDIAWILDVYIGDAVPTAPDEDRAAAYLADELQVPVLYGAESIRPSAHWLAAPGGLRTRARVYQDDDEESLKLFIDAVERPVPSLPRVRVQAIPEIIHEHRVATPVRDELMALLAPMEPGEDLLWLVRSGLGAWEAFVVRMVSGWPPDGWYPADYYRENLEGRDRLEASLGVLPETVAGLFGAAVSDVDHQFAAATCEVGDPARLLATLGVDPSLSASRAWWWRRLPEVEPWRTEPGRAT
jgi:hypothetical protein